MRVVFFLYTMLIYTNQAHGRDYMYYMHTIYRHTKQSRLNQD